MPPLQLPIPFSLLWYPPDMRCSLHPMPSLMHLISISGSGYLPVRSRGVRVLVVPREDHGWPIREHSNCAQLAPTVRTKMCMYVVGTPLPH